MKKTIPILLIILLVATIVLSCGGTSPPPLPPKVYVGSINSDIYHFPSCQWAKEIHPENQIWFSSAQDARDHGYRACQVCKPP